MTVQDFIDPIVDAIKGVFSGFGDGLTVLYRTLILDYDAGVDTILGTSDDVYNGLTDFTTIGLVFLGIAIGMGIVMLIFKKFLS